MPIPAWKTNVSKLILKLMQLWFIATHFTHNLRVLV